MLSSVAPDVLRVEAPVEVHHVGAVAEAPPHPRVLPVVLLNLRINEVEE